MAYMLTISSRIYSNFKCLIHLTLIHYIWCSVHQYQFVEVNLGVDFDYLNNIYYFENYIDILTLENQLFFKKSNNLLIMVPLMQHINGGLLGTSIVSINDL